MDSLPVEITMEIDEPIALPFTYWDTDTASNLINIQITPSWAVFSAGEIVLDPSHLGTYTMTISISDGQNQITQNVTVVVTQRADIWVQSIGILDRNTGENSIIEGNDIGIDIFVRNSGNSIAQPVTIRCSVNGQTIGTPQIAMISPGGLETASCDEWNRLDIQSGEVTLEIEIDWTDEVDETNEGNNLWSTIITVEDRDIDNSDSDNNEQAQSFLNDYNSALWVSVIVLGLVALLIFMYGPNQIRKVE